MPVLVVIAVALYVVAALFVVLFTASFGVLLVIYAITRRRAPLAPTVTDDELPSVTVQLPIYNEAGVVCRLIDACACLDYPPGKLHIQILDDSTDHTTGIIQQRVRRWERSGVRYISHIRRETREGYKAGALAHGLSMTDSECVAVFDADFLPQPDFLRRTMPYFVTDERLALVQTRWDHLNAAYNALTRAQALSVDAHFAVEQVARSRGHLPMSMNGTGGIWRVAAIQDAGGWSDVTLTEDLDLSYRALLRGWHFHYLADVAVPGELTPQLQAYKVQQARWATGSTQCLIRHARALLRSDRFDWPRRFMGLMHLCQYAVQPFILLLFLLTPVILWAEAVHTLPDLRLLSLVGIIPVLIITLGQQALHRDWLARMRYFPVQFVIASGLVLNNSLAVFQAFRASRQEFKRTPKFRITSSGSRWTASIYALPVGLMTYGELLLMVYACAGAVIALDRFPALVPYMLSYAGAFGLVALWNLYQAQQIHHQQTGQNAEHLSEQMYTHH